MTHIDQFIEALFYRASDDNAGVKIVVSVKYLHIFKVHIIIIGGFPSKLLGVYITPHPFLILK